MTAVRIKRVYEPKDKLDGFRILVDRLWPRGLKKDTAGIDEWLKDIAPSVELRKWFGHDPKRWTAFQSKYSIELQQNDALKILIDWVQTHQSVTLLYGAKDERHNHAMVILEQLHNSIKSIKDANKKR
jgi:uncharacterized protein YeaO (DUF488 family)